MYSITHLILLSLLTGIVSAILSSMTKHNDTCKLAFGRPSKHTNCPRCEELKTGAKPRAWAISKAKQADAMRSKAIYAHNCIKSNCGPVCTAFDW